MIVYDVLLGDREARDVRLVRHEDQRSLGFRLVPPRGDFVLSIDRRFPDRGSLWLQKSQEGM